LESRAALLLLLLLLYDWCLHVQVEGLVCDRGLTLGHLIATLREFFSRLGMKELRFKPAFNPYTEPSMEIFGWVTQLGLGYPRT
jgi:phenylalanyl-tRNA synthetase alpha subunit